MLFLDNTSHVEPLDFTYCNNFANNSEILPIKLMKYKDFALKFLFFVRITNTQFNLQMVFILEFLIKNGHGKKILLMC